MLHHPAASTPEGTVAASLLARNAPSRRFFDAEADRLAEACRQMAERFARGGRLLAMGRGPSATDAQHVAVEFVHPVLVGKRALPALDLSAAPIPLTRAIVRPADIVMGFGPPAGDARIAAALAIARTVGAQTFALPGTLADYAVAPPDADPFIHQELIEILYHTLWETVHVFLEHREAGHDVGPAGFLYPYLGSDTQDTTALLTDVASSIRDKAVTDERLREALASSSCDVIADAAAVIRESVANGGTVFAFGNGGSATDANDFALDCVGAPEGARPIPALSLSAEPACLTAIANDVGRDVMFVRQIIAHGQAGDVALAISTSGGSANVIAGLAAARQRGMSTVALLGYDGGEIVRRGLADVAIVVSCDYIPRIQEVQASAYHTLIDLLRADR
jgi:D-sedoheptulose 7-phosphate isomerase